MGKNLEVSYAQCLSQQDVGFLVLVPQLPTCNHASPHKDNDLNLLNCKPPPQLKVLLIRVAMVSVSSQQ